MTIINEICAAIKRNPKINRVIVPAWEWVQIHDEFDDLTFVKRSPRPTYGGRFGNIDRLLWDELEAMMKRVPIQILGRPVIARLHGDRQIPPL